MGSLAVLEEVLKMKDDDIKAMDIEDHNGRTPLMHLLRQRHGLCEGENREELEAKFTILFRKLFGAVQDDNRKWMKRRPVLHDDESPINLKALAYTELLHAARGGYESLRLMLKKVGRGKTLDEILGMETPCAMTPPPSSSNEDLKDLGRGMLIASAVKGGDVKVLKAVVRAIKTGKFDKCVYVGDNNGAREENTNEDGKTNQGGEREEQKGEDDGGSGRLMAAINAVTSSGRSLYSLAVLSGNVLAVEEVHKILSDNIDDKTSKKQEIWNLMRGMLGGKQSEISALTCASSVPYEAVGYGKDIRLSPPEDHGEAMLDTVYKKVDEAAQEMFGQDRADDEVMQNVLVHGAQESRITPLAGAVFSQNWVLFKRIMANHKWSRDQLRALIPEEPPEAVTGREHEEMHERERHTYTSNESRKTRLSSVMWRDIYEAYCADGAGTSRPADKKRSKSGLEATSAGRGSDSSDSYSKKRLGALEEYEEETKESNDEDGQQSTPGKQLSWRDRFRPYSSRAVKVAIDAGNFDNLRELVKEGFPLHETEIDKLLEHVDLHEHVIVDIIMFTVGNSRNPFEVGARASEAIKQALLHFPMHCASLRRLQAIIDDLSNEILDQLPHSLRGIGSALLEMRVGDFRAQNPGQIQDMRPMFAGFIFVEGILAPYLINHQHAPDERRHDGPAHKDPLRYALNRGSEAREFVNKPLVQDYIEHKFTCTLPYWTSRSVSYPTVNKGFLKYYYQDTNRQDRLVKWDDLLLRFLQGWEYPHARKASATGGGCAEEKKSLDWNRFPHHTILPGLQFSFAGILGKPETFYEVPVIRFWFEALFYVVMVVLFCSSVLLVESDHIPAKEVIFYVFVAGTMWREILEYYDGMSSLQPPRPSRHDPPGKQQGEKIGLIASATSRYILHDTWNLLDILTVGTVFLAFIFRLLGTQHFGGPTPGDSFFAAQFFLAASAPLVFARLLQVPQVDRALIGPMTQIIWRMLSQTLRFSVFVIIFMVSFALAFHALFFKCNDDTYLGESFGSFVQALVFVFGAPLGDFELKNFFDAEVQCPKHPAPGRARDAGTLLLVCYLIVMAIVLFNLLIATLSTTHKEVNRNGEQEFVLARTKILVQSVRAVTLRRVPPPLNICQLACGIAIDVVGGIWQRTLPAEKRDPHQRPPSSTLGWDRLQGLFERLVFAGTMGICVIVVNALLWILSLPFLAWNLVRWVVPKASFGKKDVSDDKGTRCERKGHLRKLSELTVVIFALIVGSAFATAVAVMFIMGSIVLWARGLYGIWEWMESERKGNCGVSECPRALPGLDPSGEQLWEKAWEAAEKARTHMNNFERDINAFRVTPLLQSTSGLNLELLFSRVKKRRHKNFKRDNEMDCVDLKRSFRDLLPVAEAETSTPIIRCTCGKAHDIAIPSSVSRWEMKTTTTQCDCGKAYCVVAVRKDEGQSP